MAWPKGVPRNPRVEDVQEMPKTPVPAGLRRGCAVRPFAFVSNGSHLTFRPGQMVLVEPAQQVAMEAAEAPVDWEDVV